MAVRAKTMLFLQMLNGVGCMVMTERMGWRLTIIAVCVKPLFCQSRRRRRRLHFSPDKEYYVLLTESLICLCFYLYPLWVEWQLIFLPPKREWSFNRQQSPIIPESSVDVDAILLYYQLSSYYHCNFNYLSDTIHKQQTSYLYQRKVSSIAK